jgi:putative chitinase
MPVLKQGSTGPDVRNLQQQLKDLGFDPNGVDGNFGPGTRAAVIAFQRSKGLQANGMAGPATMAALQSASKPSGTPSDAGSTGSATNGLTTPASNLNLSGLAGKVPAGVIAQIPETAAKFNITTNLRLAHFLAQCALESVNFTAVVENMNYRAARLMQIFPKYFRGVDPAAYANNPAKIANRVYANRMGNGNEASGDGFKFRGRGYIQLTGRNNYTQFSKFLGEDCVDNPDLVATTYPLASAAFYFDVNNIWAICDRGANDATVTKVTKAVNGGTHGLAGRLQNFKKFMQALA